jgi:hypothetical protein
MISEPISVGGRKSPGVNSSAAEANQTSAPYKVRPMESLKGKKLLRIRVFALGFEGRFHTRFDRIRITPKI